MKVPLCKAYTGDEEANAVREILNSELPWLAHGPKNKELEKNFAEYIGVKHAITVNSCASALFLSILCNDIKKEVIVPSFTFSASANPIVAAGAKPVFVDMDEKTFNIDTKKIEELITEETEAIMPVHLFGQCSDMDEIERIAKKHDLKVIEDSAETIGGTFNGKQAGSYGTGCFSFFPTKNMTTGEGGVITSNDDGFIDKVKKWMAHGISKDPEKPWRRYAVLPGYNFRMSNINAAIGVEQFKKLKWMNEQRVKHADYLNRNLKGVETPYVDERATHVYQTYVIKLPKEVNRDEFVKFLNSKEIEASVHFDPPVHLQEFYKEKFRSGDLSITEDVCKRIVTLPMFPELTQEQLDYVVANVEEALKK